MKYFLSSANKLTFVVDLHPPRLMILLCKVHRADYFSRRGCAKEPAAATPAASFIKGGEHKFTSSTLFDERER